VVEDKARLPHGKKIAKVVDEALDVSSCLSATAAEKRLDEFANRDVPNLQVSAHGQGGGGPAPPVSA
jgi:hypothetical protein